MSRIAVPAMQHWFARDHAGQSSNMKILRAILNTIVDIVMLPFRAIGRLLGAGESTAKGGRRRR